MTRPLRIELAGGLYHVTSRGDRREKIYENDKDRKEWLIVLELARHPRYISPWDIHVQRFIPLGRLN